MRVGSIMGMFEGCFFFLFFFVFHLSSFYACSLGGMKVLCKKEDE